VLPAAHHSQRTLSNKPSHCCEQPATPGTRISSKQGTGRCGHVPALASALHQQCQGTRQVGGVQQPGGGQHVQGPGQQGAAGRCGVREGRHLEDLVSVAVEDVQPLTQVAPVVQRHLLRDGSQGGCNSCQPMLEWLQARNRLLTGTPCSHGTYWLVEFCDAYQRRYAIRTGARCTMSLAAAHN
jgi:hypothetical protein